MFNFDLVFFKIGCKVTHFLPITQIFLKKTTFCVHTQGGFVQFILLFFDCYSCFLLLLYSKWVCL